MPSGFAFPLSASEPGALVETSFTPSAWSVTAGEERFAPAASQSWSLIGIVLPAFAALSGSYSRQRWYADAAGAAKSANGDNEVTDPHTIAPFTEVVMFTHVPPS